MSDNADVLAGLKAIAEKKIDITRPVTMADAIAQNIRNLQQTDSPSQTLLDILEDPSKVTTTENNINEFKSKLKPDKQDPATGELTQSSPEQQARQTQGEKTIKNIRLLAEKGGLDRLRVANITAANEIHTLLTNALKNHPAMRLVAEQAGLNPSAGNFDARFTAFCKKNAEGMLNNPQILASLPDQLASSIENITINNADLQTQVNENKRVVEKINSLNSEISALDAEIIDKDAGLANNLNATGASDPINPADKALYQTEKTAAETALQTEQETVKQQILTTVDTNGYSPQESINYLNRKITKTPFASFPLTEPGSKVNITSLDQAKEKLSSIKGEVEEKVQQDPRIKTHKDKINYIQQKISKITDLETAQINRAAKNTLKTPEETKKTELETIKIPEAQQKLKDQEEKTLNDLNNVVFNAVTKEWIEAAKKTETEKPDESKANKENPAYKKIEENLYNSLETRDHKLDKKQLAKYREILLKAPPGKEVEELGKEIIEDLLADRHAFDDKPELKPIIEKILNDPDPAKLKEFSEKLTEEVLRVAVIKDPKGFQKLWTEDEAMIRIMRGSLLPEMIKGAKKNITLSKHIEDLDKEGLIKNGLFDKMNGAFIFKIILLILTTLGAVALGGGGGIAALGAL